MTVATKDGPTITAGHVVLATGYELTDIVPAASHRIISTWAIATRPQPRTLWPGEAFIWEASDPYLYMRATGDGRVICGGEDEEFADEERRDALIAEKSAAIAKSSAGCFRSSTRSPEFAWAGSFGTTTHRPALYRPAAAPSAHPCRDGLWRQRHHLFADRLRDRDARRSTGRTDTRRRSFRLPEMIASVNEAR